MPVINDGVIGLRRWRETDAAFYVECSREAEVQRFTTDPATLTITDVTAAIRRSNADDDREAFLICSGDGDERIGNLAVAYDGSVAHISYWVAENARGRGAATRALSLAIRWLIEQGRADRAELWTHVDNAASRRVAERNGFAHRADRDRIIDEDQWRTSVYVLPLTR